MQGIAGSQKLEFMFSKLSNYHCKELRIPQSLKLMVPNLKKIRYQWKDLFDSKQIKNHGF